MKLVTGVEIVINMGDMEYRNQYSFLHSFEQITGRTETQMGAAYHNRGRLILLICLLTATLGISEGSSTMWRELNDQVLSFSKTLRVQNVLLEWEFSGEVLEKGVPLEKERNKKRILDVNGNIEIYLLKNKTIVIINSTAPVLGHEEKHNAQLPSKVWLEFGEGYNLNFDELFGILQVYKAPSQGTYYPIPFGIACLFPFSPVEFAILSCHPLLPLYGATSRDWQTRVISESKLAGSMNRRARLGREVKVECVVHGEQVTDIVETVTFRNGPARVRTVKVSQYHPERKFLPMRLESSVSDSRGNARITLTLKRIREQARPPLIPAGIHVNDFRLTPYEKIDRPSEGYIHYLWTGRLPTEEELKQLAYQQGNLIPPDAPRRRFSPLLFVPAIIFFALAAYLYFRNRRR